MAKPEAKKIAHVLVHGVHYTKNEDTGEHEAQKVGDIVMLTPDQAKNFAPKFISAEEYEARSQYAKRKAAALKAAEDAEDVSSNAKQDALIVATDNGEDEDADEGEDTDSSQDGDSHAKAPVVPAVNPADIEKAKTAAATKKAAAIAATTVPAKKA